MTFRFRLPAALAVAYAMAFAAVAHAQTATLLKDINTTVDVSFSSEPDGLVTLNGVGYFFASSGPGVRGLWRTDGTTAGTQLVKERLDGRHLTASGAKLFFVGNDGIHGSELWTSDGTTAGTVLVKDIGVGFADGVSPNRGILGVDGVIFFVAGDFPGNLTLWKSDGTDAGSASLLAVDPELPSAIELLGALDGVVYLYANDGVNGSELWKTDGTPAGTVLVRDIQPGAEGSYPRGVALLDGIMYFFADDGVHGYELWKSDGTVMGTSLVVDLNPGAEGSWSSDFFSRVLVGDQFYFAADNGDGSGVGLWKSDGSAVGTVRLFSSVNPTDLTSAGSLVYFLTDEGFEEPSVLWKTDGTTAGTAPIREFDSISEALASFGGALFFSALDGEQGHQLWKTNGSLAGTVLVKQINAAGSSHPGDAAVLRPNALVGGTLVFRADDGVHGAELWKTNGSEAGTMLVKDIGVSAGDGRPGIFRPVGNELYFLAFDGVSGPTQWKTDGTSEGTVLADPLPPAPQAPGFYAFDDGVNGRELWKTDGTEAGARMVKDINPGPGGSVAPELGGVMVGESFYFAADDGAHGTELWKSDGTESGTVLVRNIHPGEGQGSAPNSLFDFDGTLVFRAGSGISSFELWKSDGTEAGTALISANLDPGYSQQTISSGLLFFLTSRPGFGYRLWRTDATAAGTFPLKSLFGAFEPPSEMIDFEGQLLFTFQRSDPLSEAYVPQGSLWTSDGTVEGTILVKAFDPAPETHYPVAQLTKYNGGLYFLVQQPSGPRDLWKTDGTGEGTEKVGDLPAPAKSVWSILGPHAGSLFLDVQEGAGDATPRHIARTQGTPETTTIEEAAFLEIEGLTATGSNLFFVGNTEETGRELWTMPLLPAISSNGVVDAAGYLPALAPGGLASLFGVELAGGTTAASGFPLPTTLAGAKVKVNGIDAPLLFVSPTQINFQVPYGTPLGTGVSVVASLNGQQSLSEPTSIAEFAPAIFVNPATGEPIVQRHPDGALISAQNLAKPGDTLILYVTGLGGLDNPPPTGAAATNSPLATATTTPTVLVGGVQATVLFAGLAPDFAGLGQINIGLPGTLPTGSPLPLTIHFGASQSPTLALPF